MNNRIQGQVKLFLFSVSALSLIDLVVVMICSLSYLERMGCLPLLSSLFCIVILLKLFNLLTSKSSAD